MNTNKTKLVLAIAAATIVAAPMASAHKVSKAAAAPAKSALESRLEAMEAELQSLRAEVAKNRAEAKSEIRANADKDAATQATVEEKLAKAEETSKDNMLFFRGGFAKNSHARGTANSSAELLELNKDANDDGDGWYIGAGFEHNLTKDVWGLWDGASVNGEVMFEYKHLGQGINTLTSVLGTPTKNQITQFSVTAAPKIRFNGMGDLSPWIIPFGLGVHVISPPTNGVTVLNPGLMLGVGADYKIWKSLYAGIDFRYHFTGDDLKATLPLTGNKGTSTDGLTTGAYLGFGF
jgi:opacity protein-like surface antigen